MSRLLDVAAGHQARAEQADRIADTMAAIGAADAAAYWRGNAAMHYRAAARAGTQGAEGWPTVYRYPCEARRRSTARKTAVTVISGALIALAMLTLVVGVVLA